MESINWKKGIFRLTLVLSILIAYVMGQSLENRYSSPSLLSGFVADLWRYGYNTSNPQNWERFGFHAFLTGLFGTWVVYLIGVWIASGFTRSKEKSSIKRIFRGFVPNSDDTYKEENPQD